MPDAPHPRLGMLNSYPPYNPMNFVPFFKQQLCKIAAILTSDSGD
jgi:hypothetical protein